MQADQTLNRAQGGLGIGLTLARSLAELHGGSIAAKSDGLGKGSEFTVRLPAAIGHAAAEVVAAIDPPSVRPSAAGLRILLVDDNVDAASVLADALRAFGH